MKLYGFRPKGHGPISFFVMADNKKEAVKAIDDEIKVIQAEADKNWWQISTDGWGTDYYECKEVGAGVVLTNNNQ